jgi:hypothetical protein
MQSVGEGATEGSLSGRGGQLPWRESDPSVVRRFALTPSG